MPADAPVVRIHRDLDTVADLGGVVVVIDVFRASNTIISLLAAGAAEIALLADLDEARRLKAAEPDRPLLGERGGIAPDDFDGGNSPANAHRCIAPGARPILTTSAGTQAVDRLTSAELVLFGSFANAAAVVDLIEKRRPAEVALLPMGLEAREPAAEDDAAADWIAGRLAGREMDFDAARARALAGRGADRLRRLDQLDDLEWCTALDSHAIIPVVRPGRPPAAVALTDSDR